MCLLACKLSGKFSPISSLRAHGFPCTRLGGGKSATLTDGDVTLENLKASATEARRSPKEETN